MSAAPPIATIAAPTPEAIAQGAALLRAGEIVAMPTETVYGLAADVFNESALLKVFQAKARPLFDPLIVHVAPPDTLATGPHPTLSYLAQLELIDITTLTAEQRTQIEELTAAFWPGPLTLVLPKHSKVPDLATAGLPRVGVRMPAHPVAQMLIGAAGTPLAAPSANRFGRISPTTAAHVNEELGDRIALIFDGGPCNVGVESTVIAATAQGGFMLLRPGGISKERIEEVLRHGLLTSAIAADESNASTALLSPGQLPSHYAPGKALKLLPMSLTAMLASEPHILKTLMRGHVPGFLVFAPLTTADEWTLSQLCGALPPVVVLSATGDMGDAARHLFARLRELDSSAASALFAEPCPVTDGLGLAISDRLSRAAASVI
jgi:L-threonylcarbamoyladenylate synthase